MNLVLHFTPSCPALRIDTKAASVMNHTLMRPTPDPFSHCKLCRKGGSRPAYRLIQGIVYCCPHCDFHFLNHLDGPTVDEAASLSARGRQYIESRINDGDHLHPLRLQLVQQHCNLQDARTLDIGAGLGQFVELLLGQGAIAAGIEPSSLRRTYAQETFGLTLNPELVDHPFWQSNQRASFDLITLWDVIEHVDCPGSTLESAAALLKPGGLLCLDTPDRATFSYRLSQSVYSLSGGRLPLFLPGFYSTLRYGHKQIFTRPQISRLLQTAGLTLIDQALPLTGRRSFAGKIVLCGQKD